MSDEWSRAAESTRSTRGGDPETRPRIPRTAEQLITSLATSGVRLKELLLGLHFFANKHSINPTIRTEIFHHLNEVPMLGKNAIRAIEGMKNVIEELSGEVRILADEGEELRDNELAREQEMKKLRDENEKLRSRLESQEMGRAGIQPDMGDLIDILGAPSIIATSSNTEHSPSSTSSPLDPGALENSSTLVFTTEDTLLSTRKLPSRGNESAQVKTRSTGHEAIEQAEVQDAEDRGIRADQMIKLISDHNESARRRNSHLPTRTSLLYPLWDHVAAQPMKTFPKEVKAVWGLTHTELDDLVARLRIPKVEKWGQSSLPEKRGHFMAFCGISGVLTYDVWRA